MAYLEELDALQRWIYGTAGLTSMRLAEAPPKVARPVILWEPPFRGRDRNLGRYTYINRVQQYGKLYVTSLDQLTDYQEKLLGDLEEKVGVLPVFDSTGVKVADLKNVELEFNRSESLDVPFIIRYEIAYARTRPAAAPNATTVYNKKTVNIETQ
jgi:hypothetical protein